MASEAPGGDAGAVAVLIEERAGELAQAGRLAAAEEALRPLMEVVPDRGRARLLLARILGQQSRYEDALAVLSGVEDGEAAELRSCLEDLRSRGRQPSRRRLAVAGAASLAGVFAAVSILPFAGQGGSNGPTSVAFATGKASPRATPGRTTPGLVETLRGWTQLVRQLESLPAGHDVRLTVAERGSAVVAVVEGTVWSSTISRRVREALHRSGVASDLSGLYVATRYEIAPADSLSAVAQRIYGDPAHWTELWEANRTTLPDPNRLRPGALLFLP